MNENFQVKKVCKLKQEVRLLLLDSKATNLFMVTKDSAKILRVNICFPERVHTFRLKNFKIRKIQSIKLMKNS